jgi:hypothetical protein
MRRAPCKRSARQLPSLAAVDDLFSRQERFAANAPEDSDDIAVAHL